MDKSDLFKKIDGMNMEELSTYHNSARIANRFMDVIGILLVFSMLIFTNILFLMIGSVLLYGVAQVASSTERTIAYIENRIVDIIDK